MKSYILTLSEEQAQLVSDACDLVSRLHMGQFDAIGWDIANTMEYRDQLNSIAIQMGLRPSHNGCYGILSDKVNNKARTLWDIHQVVRHRLAWDNNPEGDIGVNFDDPFHSDHSNPLPKMTTVPTHENMATKPIVPGAVLTAERIPEPIWESVLDYEALFRVEETDDR